MLLSPLKRLASTVQLGHGLEQLGRFLSNAEVSLQKPGLLGDASLQNLLSLVALTLGVPHARVEDKAAEFRTCCHG